MGKLYLPAPISQTSAMTATVDALVPTITSTAEHGERRSTILLKQLRDFVAEVLQVIETLSVPFTADDEPAEQARQLAQEASERIARIISAKTLDLSHSESTAARAATDELRYLMAAMADGLQFLKFFPATAAGGIPMLKALAGPFPDIAFCPTGGITVETAPQFLALPNVKVCGGSWLTPQAAVDAGDWAQITRLAKVASALRA
jgi:hypothetical protein